MAKTKTAATKTKRARTGTKTTARRAAGKTAKATEVNIRRAGPRTVAAALIARGPEFWRNVKDVGDTMLVASSVTAARRVAQVEPREATH